MFQVIFKMKKHLSKIGGLLIAVSAVLVLVLFTYIYLYRDILDTKTKVEQTHLELEKDRLKDAELEAIQKNIKLTISDSDTLKALFVPADGVVDFIQNIETVGKQIGLQIETKNIEPEETDVLTAVGKENINVTLETEGSWQNSMQFLSLLSNLPYKISIISLDFSFKEKVWVSSIIFSVIKNKN